MKLWLDDERPEPEGWTRAKNVAEAVAQVIAAAMRNEVWEAASLDHDLAAEHYETDWVAEYGMYGNTRGRELTGLDFVDWMINTKTWPLNKPVVHSMNPVGRDRMRKAIDRYWGERQSG